MFSDEYKKQQVRKIPVSIKRRALNLMFPTGITDDQYEILSKFIDQSVRYSQVCVMYKINKSFMEAAKKANLDDEVGKKEVVISEYNTIAYTEDYGKIPRAV